jgi:hypothetical protein
MPTRWVRVFIVCLLLCGPAWPAKDIYLTEDRVCKRCTWAWEDANTKDWVVLTNKGGLATRVRPQEILGIDTHPFVRRFLLKSVEGVGLPGRVILPQATDTARFLR